MSIEITYVLPAQNKPHVPLNSHEWHHKKTRILKQIRVVNHLNICRKGYFGFINR